MNQEQRIELAKGWRATGWSYREIGELLGVSAAVVRGWIADAKQSPYLQPDDVARILGVSPAKVRRWCGTGELKAANMNTGKRPHFVIRRDDLDEFVKSRQAEPKVVRMNRRPFDAGSFKRYRA